MECLTVRISDPTFKSLIYKFLKAGVLEEGKYQITEQGTPQGGIISPVLANIYLHYVLDLWFERKAKQNLRGYAQLVRYADDYLIGAQHSQEVEQLLKEIEKRLNKFGLKLSAEKTSIKEFGRFAAENRQRRGEGKPETIDFLGFTHYCAQTRDGRYMVRVKTSRKKMNRAVTKLNQWLKSTRNVLPQKAIGQLLALKLQGHYNYYGISGNFEGINRRYRKSIYLTYKWLNRRSRRQSFSWEGFYRYLEAYPLPRPRLRYAIYNTW